jgi:hypothetical protein
MFPKVVSSASNHGEHDMRIFTRVTGVVRRVAHDVVDAPRVRRELRQHRAAQTSPARVPAPLIAEDIAAEPPTVAEIETAARDYEQARAETNAAARLKRTAEKILKRTPDGVHGTVTVERFESNRQVADLDAIRAIFEANGLGEVPMKRCSPSLTITFAAEDTGTAEASAPVLAPAA